MVWLIGVVLLFVWVVLVGLGLVGDTYSALAMRRVLLGRLTMWAEGRMTFLRKVVGEYTKLSCSKMSSGLESCAPGRQIWMNRSRTVFGSGLAKARKLGCIKGCPDALSGSAPPAASARRVASRVGCDPFPSASSASSPRGVRPPWVISDIKFGSWPACRSRETVSACRPRAASCRLPSLTAVFSQSRALTQSL